jgi:DNA-binding transcriptional LysR family regulator
LKNSGPCGFPEKSCAIHDVHRPFDLSVSGGTNPVPTPSKARTVHFKANTAIGITLAVMKAVVSGAGLSTGELVPVLVDWHLPQGGATTVYPAARFRPPKVTAVVEMLVESSRNEAYRVIRNLR